MAAQCALGQPADAAAQENGHGHIHRQVNAHRRRQHRTRKRAARVPQDFIQHDDAMAMRPPVMTMVQGSEPPNMPRATEAIRVACGASSGLGWAIEGTPMP